MSPISAMTPATATVTPFTATMTAAMSPFTAAMTTMMPTAMTSAVLWSKLIHFSIQAYHPSLFTIFIYVSYESLHKKGINFKKISI
jgi:hypothetical protein